MNNKTYSITKYILCFVLCSVIGILETVPVEAQDLHFKPDLTSAGWKMHTPRGKESAAFEVLADGGLKITAQHAVAFLYQFVSKDDGVSHALSWEWRVDQSFPATNLSAPGEDDRPLAIHVFFTDQDAGVMKRLGSGLAGLFGVPVSGRAITYVWGGLRPSMTMLPNPFMSEGQGVLVIRRSGQDSVTGEWVGESVDLASDYFDAFGERAPPISVVAISADTDDTGAHSQAAVRNLRLIQRPDNN